MQKYKTLLFDVDGTLLDFEATQENALKEVFASHKYTLDEQVKAMYNQINHELWRQYEKGLVTREEVIYSRFVKLFESLGLDWDVNAFEDEYQELLGQGHTLIKGAMEVVKKLHQTHELYIVTNGITRTQFSRLKLSGLDQYMKDIFVSEATGYQKPMKQYFDYCFERIPNLVLEETLIIGDSLSSDIKGGNNALIHTCWFNPKGVKVNEEVQINYEVKDLSELYGIVN